MQERAGFLSSNAQDFIEELQMTACCIAASDS